jgi:hypothetical protein
MESSTESTEYAVLAAAADAKHRRLRIFMVLLAVAAALFVFACQMPWYHLYYEPSTYGGMQLAVRPSFTLDAGQMTLVARSEPASYTVSPTVDQVMQFPIFAIAAVVGALVALAGTYFRSAAITLFGALPLGYGWLKLSAARYWFEAAPGRDGWVIERGVGQAVFWAALMLAAMSVAAGAYQSTVAYRADRRARAAGGQAVEDTAMDMFVRILARGAAQPAAVRTDRN